MAWRSWVVNYVQISPSGTRDSAEVEVEAVAAVAAVVAVAEGVAVVIATSPEEVVPSQVPSAPGK